MKDQLISFETAKSAIILAERQNIIKKVDPLFKQLNLFEK
mgnify:CR=1 FL=1